MTDLPAEERARAVQFMRGRLHGMQKLLQIGSPGGEDALADILIAFEAAAIERACQRIEAVVERGYPTPADKTDQCTHGMFGWEDCIACYDEQILAEVAAIRQLHSGEGAGS